MTRFARRRAAPSALERQDHAAVAKFLDLALPPSFWWTTVPGGDGKMTTVPGYVSGTPDILLIERAEEHGLWSTNVYWIELKRRGKKPTDEQALVHATLRAMGHQVGWTDKGIVGVDMLLIGWGVALRARA